jgi:hypothetical protein
MVMTFIMKMCVWMCAEIIRNETKKEEEKLMKLLSRFYLPSTEQD